MSNHDPNAKWVPIAFAVIFSSMFIAIGLGGMNGTSHNDVEIAKIKAQAAIAIAKERANNVESRLLALERYHRADSAKALGRLTGDQRHPEEALERTSHEERPTED